MISWLMILKLGEVHIVPDYKLTPLPSDQYVLLLNKKVNENRICVNVLCMNVA